MAWGFESLHPHHFKQNFQPSFSASAANDWVHVSHLVWALMQPFFHLRRVGVLRRRHLKGLSIGMGPRMSEPSPRAGL